VTRKRKKAGQPNSQKLNAVAGVKAAMTRNISWETLVEACR
jgi:hypothetical protein